MDDISLTHAEAAAAIAARADFVARVIRHRCGDVISEDEISVALRGTGESPDLNSSPPVMMVPKELAERLEDVLEAVVSRIEKIEAGMLRGKAEGSA
jgi:hypothetical protein